MVKLGLQLIFILICWWSSFKIGDTSEVITEVEVRTTRLREQQTPANKSQASALILTPHLYFPKQFEVYKYDAYSKDGIQLKKANSDVEMNQNVSLSSITTQESPFGSRLLFGKRESSSYRHDQLHYSVGIDRIKNPVKENFILQELHLRYLMSSTAEQPDNSGRASTFNIWLTILIAALAAAILS